MAKCLNHQLEIIVQAIRQYLEDFPQAADNLSGIANWWLDDELHPSLEMVENALVHLVSEGTVITKMTASGETIFLKAPTPMNESEVT